MLKEPRHLILKVTGIVFEFCKSIRRHLDFQQLKVRAQIAEPLLIPFSVWSHQTRHAFLRPSNPLFGSDESIVAEMQTPTRRAEVNRDVLAIWQLRRMLDS
jgi:hypothetical protein